MVVLVGRQGLGLLRGPTLQARRDSSYPQRGDNLEIDSLGNLEKVVSDSVFHKEYLKVIFSIIFPGWDCPSHCSL